MGTGEAEPERARAVSGELEIGDRLEAYRESRASDVTRLRVVAHEINNPVQSIMNYASLIARHSQADDVANFAQEILNESQRLAAIVRGLLSLARHEGGPYTDVSVPELVSGALSLIAVPLGNDGIAVDVSNVEDGPPICCQAQQIQRVLMSLLSNTRNALNRRYPGAHDAKRIVVRSRCWLRESDVFIRLTIAIGVPVGLLDEIFDPFNTANAQGLGLSVSHGIVVEHGGAISVESDPTGSTRFHVDLPVATRNRPVMREVVSR
jgi:signal transduction histidine kinase